MIKKLLCVIFIFFLTGCYNYQEINGLAIITAIGIDKKDDKYHVSYQVINPKSNSSSTDSNQTDFIVIESSEKEVKMETVIDDDTEIIDLDEEDE